MNAIGDLACALHGKCASVNNVITDMAKHILNIKRNIHTYVEPCLTGIYHELY